MAIHIMKIKRIVNGGIYWNLKYNIKITKINYNSIHFDNYLIVTDDVNVCTL